MRTAVEIAVTWDSSDVQTGGDVQVRAAGRWWRLAAYYGEAPGMHKGLWRTHTGGPRAVRGYNLRLGPLRRCLTLIAHRRPRT